MVIDEAWRKMHAVFNDDGVAEEVKRDLAIEICKKTCPKEHHISVDRNIKYISSIPKRVIEDCKKIIEVKAEVCDVGMGANRIKEVVKEGAG
jgi:hypothetical protein